MLDSCKSSKGENSSNRGIDNIREEMLSELILTKQMGLP
jgi:hypothetical protein